jgi:hypothetical protein
MKKQYYEHDYIRTLQVRSPSITIGREVKAMPGMPGMLRTLQTRPPGQAFLSGIINRICSEFCSDCSSARGGRECAEKTAPESSAADREGNTAGDDAA